MFITSQFICFKLLVLLIVNEKEMCHIGSIFAHFITKAKFFSSQRDSLVW